MKTTIFYFSGTGNCLQVARDLAAELGEADVVPVAKALKGGIDTSAERIGLVFPVYAFNMPLIISDFIGRLKTPPEKYIFAIATYAGLSADTLGHLARKLKGRGLKLSAGFGIVMPNNYTPLYGAISAEKQERLFAAARARVREIAPVIKEAGRHRIERAKLPLRALGWALYPLLLLISRSEDKNFRADENCDGCGTCEKVCPVNNITLADKRPVWLHRCEQCFACFHWCPREAIQYGRNTKGRRRYRNPSVTLKDFIQ